MPVKITLAQLKKMNACSSHLSLFKQTFGKSVEVTAENVNIARKAKLDVAWLARNPNTPTEVLTTLATDEDAVVRYYVAYNLSTPPDVLATLATDGDESVRLSVVYNPSTPTEVLATLAKEKDEYVRRCVALNPNTAPEVLATLAKDEDRLVRQYVASNPSTPSECVLNCTIGISKGIDKHDTHLPQ